MALKLTEEQEMILETARKFAVNDVEPVANKIDQEEHMPEALLAKCAELGLYGLYIPEEYGGSGQSLTTTCLAIEEISKASPSLGGALSVQVVLCPAAFRFGASEDQKRKFLTGATSGEKVMAWSMSEDVGAINLALHKTRLTNDGDGFRLNGLKLFCTQGNASTIMVFARTSRDERQGYGIAIVEEGMEGFDPVPPEDKLGWRGTNTGTIAYNNIYIPRENILGGLLTGLADIGPSASMGTLGHCASALGCVEGMFDKTVAYVKDRELYGGPMSRLQPISYWLAEVWTKIEACRSLLYSITDAYDEDDYDTLRAGACKAFLCDTAFDCSSKLLQMWGGTGIMHSTGINRYFRDARTKMVAEGPSETHYSNVAAQLLETTPVSWEDPQVQEWVGRYNALESD